MPSTRPSCPRRRAAPKAPRPWILALGLALVSLAWLLVRSARNPARLRYPCQRAALSHVTLLLALPLAHLIARRADPRRRLVTAGLGAALVGVLLLGDLADPVEALSRSRGIAPPPHADYTATLYLVEGAGGPSGTHHLGVDELLACMGADGTAFYRSPTPGPESGPDGIVGASDLVLVKINAQWAQRGGTNTDVLQGVIARVLEHPDGFTGEVVVVENTQGVGMLDWPEANAEDHGQSAADVVREFAEGGHPVSSYLWDTVRGISVAEYDQGDDRDGYVVGPLDPETHGSVSYPKFRTAGGRRVSLARGIWNPATSTYDDVALTFLNIPVLKCHGAVYGVTAAVKNHMGSMTTALSTSAHSSVRYGMLGKFLADVRRPDLNILDCIWVLARPPYGPSCTYAQATRLDALMAAKDPVALDLWATKNLLVPAILANGYTTYPMQDPDDPASIFRTYLDASMNEMLRAGIDVTNDPARMRVVSSAALGVETPAPAATNPVATAAPNPFTGATTLRFALPGTAPFRVEIFDVSGRRVRTLHAARGSAAEGETRWDGRDDAGRRVVPGTYCVRVSSGGAVAGGKVTRRE